MKTELKSLIDSFKRNKALSQYDEAKTKQAVIMRILQILGWDVFNVDEVCPEYPVDGNKVDFALICKGERKVFIEVKKVGENLERHQRQLLNYAFKEGVKLAVLTNGITWWFYLPLREGSWEQRKFYTIEIYDQDSEDISEKFVDFLSRKNVCSDKAIEKAEDLYRSRKKLNLIKETLPKAWEKITTEPDEILVELLADTTEKLCGYKPDAKIVKEFILQIAEGKKPDVESIELDLRKGSSTKLKGSAKVAYEFLMGFYEYISNYTPNIKPPRESTPYNLDFPLKTSKAGLRVGVSILQKYLRIGIVFKKNLFDNFKKYENELRRIFEGEEVRVESPSSHKKYAFADVFKRNVDFHDRSRWNEYFSWLYDKYRKLKDFFEKHRHELLKER